MANSKEQACWNESLVEVFVDICIKEVHRNSKPQSHFTSEGWNTIITSFVEQTGKDYTKKQLKIKWDAIKGEWRLWKDLKNKYTGLGWDSKLNTVVVTEERWSQIIGKTKEYASDDSDERDVSNYTRSSKRKKSERALKDKEKRPKKVGGAAQLAKEIGRMCSAIESRSTTSSMISNARTSITEVMKDVTSLPGAE
ncbi:L10-interacting MYB domain-containing protein-like [Argentina anserina]|uniref:L10-interacting MYB domain-containing protein-like n=1 Tax=Argentina anserina TaxID=57926 RepID=UPI002176588E|nr:L10-interacting MYB domain-containing protein-like [Potentilla anserina]